MRIVVIGNGAAGNSAVETIKKHRPQVETIMVARERFPFYSACALPDCLAGWVERPQLFLKQVADYERMGISARLGCEVMGVDAARRTVTVGSENISYDGLIIACGSRAIIPPIEGTELAGNFVVKSVSDIDAIMAHGPRRVVVVGSGNIGVEAAGALAHQGCEVTLVEMMGHILPRNFDPELACRIQVLLEREGVAVFTGEQVCQVKGGDRVEAVVTSGQEIVCDTVIWAVGVRQNVELARQAGVELGSLGGIKVNSHMETSISGIWACGDCIESFDILTGEPTLSLLWPSARRQGEVAALNCLGRQAEYEGSLDVVVEEISGVVLVSIGWTSAGLAGRDIEVLEDYGEEWGFRVLVVDDRIMGFQSVGVTASVGVMTALMKKRMPVSEFWSLVKHPVLAEKFWWFLPARRFLNPGSGTI